MKNELTWAAIQPLVGGMAFGAENVFGKDPEYVLSWAGCFKNEKAYIDNRPQLEGKYYLIDSEKGIDPTYVDVVVGVPVCSALSSLNVKSSADYKSVNNMYEMAEIVLGKIKPKVYIFENAPHLYTNKGEKVREHLLKLGEKFGYNSSIVETDTYLHGVPQHRQRTFWYFWNGPVPLLEYYEKKAPTLEKFLGSIPKRSPHYKDYPNRSNLQDNIWYKYVVSEFGDKWRDAIVEEESGTKTIMSKISSKKSPLRDKHFEKFNAFIQKHGTEKDIRYWEHVKYKHDMDMGAWDQSPIVVKGYVNAVQGRNLSNQVHPTEDRWFNARELMALMGLPNDFKIEAKNFRIVSQNVPVMTATDWIAQAKKYCEGSLELTTEKYIMQSNKKKAVTYPKKFQQSKSDMDDFI